MKKFIILLAITAFTCCTIVFAQTSPSAGKPMLADRHISDQGFTCTECHNEEKPKDNPKKELCLNCHGPLEELAARTDLEEANPHSSHQGELPCGECHKGHKKSISFCDQCHSFGFTTP